MHNNYFQASALHIAIPYNHTVDLYIYVYIYVYDFNKCIYVYVAKCLHYIRMLVLAA